MVGEGLEHQEKPYDKRNDVLRVVGEGLKHQEKPYDGKKDIFQL